MNSPVFRAERQHLQMIAARTLSSRRRLERWGLLALFSGALLIAALLFGMELLAATNAGFATSLVAQASTMNMIAHVLPSFFLVPATILLHLVFLLQLALQSSDVILRERRSGTWQILLLTERTPRQIILAKWWAVVLHNLPFCLVLAAMRLGTIIYLGLERYRIDYFPTFRTTAAFPYTVRPLPFVVDVSTLLLGAALITLFSVANLLFTAAAGVLVSAVKQGRRSGERVALTFIAQLVIMGLPAVLLLLGAEEVYNQSVPIAPPTTNFVLTTHLSALGISLVDNGILASAAFLTAPRYILNFVLERPYTQFFPPGVIPLTLAFYALAAAATLIASIHVIRRSGH